MPVEEIDGWKANIFFDDSQKTKKVRTPRLQIKTHIQNANSKLTVHKGGLYKPPIRKDTDEPLSAEFGEFLEKERSEVHNPS